MPEESTGTIDLSQDSSSVVQFNDDDAVAYPAIKFYRQPDPPQMVIWLATHSGGLIKTHRQANMVLMIGAGLFFVISLYFFIAGDSLFRGPMAPPSTPYLMMHRI